MKKKSVAKNYIYSLLYEVLAIIIPLATTPYLSRVLHAERIGIYSYTLSIVTYFILFGSLGIAMYGRREIAYNQDDKEKRSIVFYEIFILKCISLLLSMIIFYFVFCVNGEYSFYYRFLLFEIIANILDISWFFQGMEEFKKTVIRNSLVKIISAICIFVFIKTQNDLWKYFVIYVGSNFIANISLWLYMPKYINKIEIKSLNIKRHLKPTIMLFLPQIATQVYTVLDKSMLGAIIPDKAESGFYEQAQKIIKLLMTIATSFGTVMMPRIASIYANGNKEKIREYIDRSFSFITMLTIPMMFGIISISNKFVPVFFGDGFDKVTPILCIISPIIVIIGLSNVIGTQYLLPTKQQNKYTISVVVGAIVNFFLNLLLIKSYKSIGASIATVIAELAVTTTQLILVRKEFKIIDIFKLIYKYILAGILMFIVSIFISINITNNMISIVVQFIVSATVYFVVLLSMKDSMLFEILLKLKKGVKHEN